MRIEFLDDAGPFRAGEVYDLDPLEAARWKNRGDAVDAEEANPPTVSAVSEAIGSSMESGAEGAVAALALGVAEHRPQHARRRAR